MIYESYTDYICSVVKNDLKTSNFKSNHNYNGVLEHVSKTQGDDYIKLIKKIAESSFPEITVDNIKNFLIINDKYGYPNKEIFIFFDNSTVSCSPTSLRYIYHALEILEYYKMKTGVKKIVEVGCGYGGLFLSISYFAKILNIQIDHYYLIDLPEICRLIDSYTTLHKDIINISFSTHTAFNYGSDISEKDLFLISNYCFTEIEKDHRDKYIETLFPKISSGFITWQTITGLPIYQTYIINKTVYKIDEERPQTANERFKNYFVYF